MGAPKSDRKRSRAEAEDPASLDLEDRDNGAVQSTKKARIEERRSLFVRSLPPAATSESLTDFFSQHYPVKHAVVVVDQKTKESRGYGFVTFADAEDALAAKGSLNNKEWDGRRLRLDVAEPRHRNAANGPGETPAGKPSKQEFQKAPKLIVRNLPWSVKTSEQLSHLFRSFGKVKFADLPQSKGKLKGFGFVTIRGKKNAERALEAINGKEIDGRTIAVDWAVDKETWAQQNQEEEGKEEEEEEEPEQAEDDDDDDEDATSEDEDEEGGAKTKRDSELDADLENFIKNHMQNLEDEDEDDEDKDEAEDAKEQKPPKQLMTDNSATVFIRNLPFTTTDAQLKGFFESFGKVRYARVVMDKVTEKPAGTGFVCFVSGDDAKECIKNAPRSAQPTSTAKNSILQDESLDPEGKYTLDGRLLQVAQAVNKEQAANLADSALAKRNQKDKRHLFLLNEGSIGSQNPLYDMMTPSEIQLRQTSAAQRRKLVQSNPSLHMSLTRLALRNIPRNVDSRALKDLARKAIVGFAKDVKEGRRKPLSKEENARDGKDVKEKEQERRAKGKGIVRQAKVVYESAKGTKMKEDDAGGKSRGYGFIEYTSHHWALMGLRFLNGFQVEGENGKKSRLLVEFAIENAQVVQRRRALEEKSRQQQPQKKGEGAKEDDNAEQEEDDQSSRRKGGKGKGNARGPKGSKAGDRKAEGGDKPKAPKEDMQQKLIARKRLMRKKKAVSRAKN